MIDLTQSDFYKAWVAWDRRPGDIDTTARFCAEGEALARRLGVVHMELNNQLMEYRRSGLSREQAMINIAAR